MKAFGTVVASLASATVAVMAYRHLDKQLEVPEGAGLIIAHNQTHEAEWGISYEEFMTRFEAIAIYVKASVRETKTRITKKPLLSALAVLDDQDVAMLLAAGIVRTHNFPEYAKTYDDHDLLFDAFNFRYCTQKQFEDNELDIFVVKVQPDDLKKLAEHLRTRTKEKQNVHVAAEVRKHRASILNLLESAREFGKV